jgi:hypothetical protein
MFTSKPEEDEEVSPQHHKKIRDEIAKKTTMPNTNTLSKADTTSENKPRTSSLEGQQNQAGTSQRYQVSPHRAAVE